MYRYEWVVGWYRVLYGKEVSMANDHKKRISNRHSIKGPITLYSTIGMSKEFDAHLLNFSEQGICFTTKTKMVPGTTMLLKASNEYHPLSWLWISICWSYCVRFDSALPYHPDTSNFFPLKNVSRASITTPVMVLPFSLAYLSARSANLQGI